MQRNYIWSARRNKMSQSHRDRRFRRRLSVEHFEDRRMLATFTVNNLNDAPVAMAGAAPGTLRQAIYDANVDAVADVIEFQAGLSGTITLTAGQLVISKALSINGPGATLLTVDASGNDPTPNSTLNDGNNTNDGDGSRIFDINDGGFFSLIDVSVSGITLTGGDSTEGGAIRSVENLAIADAVLTDNVTTAAGGGIYMAGQIVTPMLTIHRATISHNASGAYGGAVAIGNPLPIEITQSTLAFNQAHGDGGAIYHDSGAPLTVTQSTISHNSSRGSGGGTFNNNSGGPIRADLTIRHSVVSGNTSDSDQNGSGAGGGIYDIEMFVILDHAIIAGNTDHSNTANDLSQGFSLSRRFSLIGDGDGAFGSLPEAPVGMPDANGNLVGGPINGIINPLLGPLANNGGPTMTHALLTGSPAIDAGDPAFTAPPTYDQRGAPFGRVVNGDGTSGARIDMGPFEFVPSAKPELPGDYNDNNTVDAADYVLWRKHRNTATQLPNDATSGVDDGDYGVWRANFGTSPQAGGGAAILAASEDESFFLVTQASARTKLPTVSMAADSRSGALAAVDLVMAKLATSHGNVDRRANLWLQRASQAEGTARTLLLLDSVFERVTRAEARIGDGTCSDELAVDGDNQLIVEINARLFAEVL